MSVHSHIDEPGFLGYGVGSCFSFLGGGLGGWTVVGVWGLTWGFVCRGRLCVCVCRTDTQRERENERERERERESCSRTKSYQIELSYI